MGNGGAPQASGGLGQGSTIQNPQGHVAPTLEARRQVAMAQRPPRPPEEDSRGIRSPQEAIGGSLLCRQGRHRCRFAGDLLLHGPRRVCLQGRLNAVIAIDSVG